MTAQTSTKWRFHLRVAIEVDARDYDDAELQQLRLCERVEQRLQTWLDSRVGRRKILYVGTLCEPSEV